jgi:myo-inositol-1(or 4)-monophosphatase
MNNHPHTDTLSHIEQALEHARGILREYVNGDIEVERKTGGDPVTAADNAVNEFLRNFLPRDAEGWLSEETTDDLARLDKERVWIVDPLDGTKEFVARIPEWCVSIGLVENGKAVAGGILNPQTNELFLGAMNFGVTLNNTRVTVSDRPNLSGGLVLASRSEFGRGEWRAFENAPYTIQPMGSVAYKLARVAAGLADATWTLIPKNEWDVAAGIALVGAAGGTVYAPEMASVELNNRNTTLKGLVAHSPRLVDEVHQELEHRGNVSSFSAPCS